MPDPSPLARVRLGRVAAQDRTVYIVDASKNRAVLHVGCVDSPLLDERLVTGTLLHGKLRAVASTLVGVDLDSAGLQRMRAAGYEDLYECDVEKLGGVDFGRTFDTVIAGEVIEHLANPGLFLAALPRVMSSTAHLVVTVPNALSIRMLANTARAREVVHRDHNAYYSAYTLAHLLQTHSFDVVDIRPYWTSPRRAPILLSLYDRAIQMARFISPWFGEGLMATARYVGKSR